MPNPLPGELWAQIETLFLAATGLPASRRESYVASRCGDDLRIRDEVLSLLSFCDEDTPELLAAVASGAATFLNGREWDPNLHTLREAERLLAGS